MFAALHGMNELMKNFLQRNNVRLGADDLYKVDGTCPMAVVEPANEQEMSRWLTECFRHRAVVNVWGGGVHQATGGHLDPYDIALSTARMKRIVEYEPDNLTLSAEAGVTIHDVQKVVQQQDLMFPVNPPSVGKITLGGFVAANCFGSLCHRYGTARDLLLGLKAVLADGSVVRFGGKTVKNVAGYDVAKLLIGSMGTLAVIVEMTFRLWPKPKSVYSTRFYVSTLDELEALLRDINSSTLPILDVVLHSVKTGTPAGVTLSMRIEEEEGMEEKIVAIHPRIDCKRTHGDRLFDPQPDLESFFTADRNRILLRWHVPKSAVNDVFKLLETDPASRVLPVEVVSYPTRGIVYCRMANEEETLAVVKRWREKAQSLGGFVIIEKASEEFKNKMDAWQMDSAQLRYQRKIKEEFDPNRVFATGRFLGGL